ncbi:YmfQ family protein [Paenibacillus dokdonensis]|uniref:YmfQ family protein n=1 Tax=Paenibacillus dokdonensis TaxID=2567944 RepID=UPI0010A78B98|nr:YmfQ family protein [Paenibacillus dokdonensis]
MPEFQITSPRGAELFSYLPGYYESSRVIKADMNAKGTEMDALFATINDSLDQFFVRTATWGLDQWEYELGITTDLAKPIEQRRALVESKLRGAGKFTGRLVKNVAEAYDGGAVDVSFQPEVWSFTVKFIDTVGVPPNLDDLKSVIEEIKPAHLEVIYEFSYLLIRDINKVMTFNQLKQLPFSKLAFRRTGGA